MIQKDKNEIEVRCDCGTWHYMPVEDYMPEGEPYECVECYKKQIDYTLWHG